MRNKDKFDLGKVSKLQEIRTKIVELNNDIDALGGPLLADLALLPKIYEIYVQYFARRGFPQGATMVYNRKKFIFVCLYLFCPRALAGERMRSGLRKRISALFGLNCSSPISDNTAGLMRLYHAYLDFRCDVEDILDEVFEELDMCNEETDEM